MSWIKVFARRKDTRADTAGTDGKFGELQLNAVGELRVIVDPLATANNGGDAVDVTNTPSVTLLAANSLRRSAIVQNLSTTRMLTVRLGSPAVTLHGINLAPAIDATHPGGSVMITGYTGIITGIMSGADAIADNVSVAEV